MGRTFTQIRAFSSDGVLRHDFFKVPKGKSAIVDMIINVQYAYGGGSALDQISIAMAATLTKADGSSGTILTNTFAPKAATSSVLRLERCALESGDTISVYVSTQGGIRFGTSVYLGGVLQ